MKRRELLRNTFVSAATLALFSPQTWAKTTICNPDGTPRQISGPFYPTVDFQEDQLDSDADLVVLDGASDKAVGDIVIIEGKVTDQYCNAISGALVEIWQACATGKYNHEDDTNTAVIDPNFQYWGKALTDANGFYRFRTIIPGSYPADVGWNRPPHIHFKVTGVGYNELITQMYFKGDKLNGMDKILQSLKKSDQDKLIVEFKLQASQNYPVGQFDIRMKNII